MSGGKLLAFPGGRRPGVQAALWDHDAEREVLGMVLCTSPEEARAILDLVPMDDWELARHRAIAEAMAACALRGETVEPMAIRAAMVDLGTYELHGGARCLSEVSERQGLCSNVRVYAERIRRKAIERRLASAWQAGASDVLEQREDMRAGRLTEVRELEAELADLGKPEVTARDKVDAMLERIRNPALRRVYSTGLPVLDRPLDGGLCPGWLVVILAAPKQGKTVLATNNLGRAIMRAGEPLLYIGEMAEEELMARWLACESGVPLRGQRKGDLSGLQWSAAVNAADTMARWTWGVRFISSLAAIERDARAFRAKHGRLGMLVVDYVQLVRNGIDNLVQDLEHTTRGLKLLAAELDCVVVMVSQPDKASSRDKTELGLYDGKGSGAIASDCDLMLVPMRDPQDPSRAGLSAPGFRHGEAFKLEIGALRFSGARMAFEGA